MNKYKINGTIIILLLFFVFIGNASEININDINKRMNTALNTIEMGVRGGQIFKIMSDQNEFESLGRAIGGSQENSQIIFSSKIEYSKLFLVSLLYNTEVFENFINFSKAGRIPLSSYFNVLDASVDLAMKARLIKKSNTDRVEVKVNTIDQQGKDVQMCFVWYSPFFIDDDQHKRKFDKVSTPTTDIVPAGKWIIWTEKDGKIGRKTPFYCGKDGQDKREIDIEAP